MAKRSAYGRTEEARLVKHLTTESGHSFPSVYSIMSDGRVLRKNGNRWTVVKLKVGLTLTRMTELLISKGYKLMRPLNKACHCRSQIKPSNKRYPPHKPGECIWMGEYFVWRQGKKVWICEGCELDSDRMVE